MVHIHGAQSLLLALLIRDHSWLLSKYHMQCQELYQSLLSIRPASKLCLYLQHQIYHVYAVVSGTLWTIKSISHNWFNHCSKIHFELVSSQKWKNIEIILALPIPQEKSNPELRHIFSNSMQYISTGLKIIYMFILVLI